MAAILRYNPDSLPGFVLRACLFRRKALLPRGIPQEELLGQRVNVSVMPLRRTSVFWCVFALVASVIPAACPAAQTRFPVGSLASGPLDLITDVPGVLVGQVTKIEGEGPRIEGRGPVRTGVTVVLPNADPWNERVAAATYALNGNGEMTGAHWVDEAGFLEVPIALTNTLDVGRVDDGVVEWMLRRYPAIGVRDDVPLPVVAECDDQALNDIRGRHVGADDVVHALDAAAGGAFARGGVGAGTGMRAFGFKAGIGSASRRTASGAYTVGVLVNANTGAREQLRIEGVPVGRLLAHEYLPIFPKDAAFRLRGRAADGSIVVVVATDAPLEHRQLRELAVRATLGLARSGATSHVSSGDLFIAFSTTNLTPREGAARASRTLVADPDVLDTIFDATVEATEAAIDDALLSARTTTGADGITFFALPEARVRALVGTRAGAGAK
jgi:D-aminopeptidase